MAQHSVTHAADARPHQPVRTCVGCRKTALSVDLLRVTARRTDTTIEVVPDEGRKLPGRGAYLHRELECLLRADQRRAFGRALRVSGQLDAAPVKTWFERNRANT